MSEVTETKIDKNEVDESKLKHPISLTSIKIFKDKYSTFKGITNDDGFTLQKLVNRSLFLYVTDEDFRNKLRSTNDLQKSGSSF